MTSMLADELEERKKETRIPLRIQQQIGFLLLFSAPGVLLVLLSQLLLSETRSLIIESVLLVFTNILGWLCIVSALSDSQASAPGNQGSSTGQDRSTWSTRMEAFLGVSLKLVAIVWGILRFLSGGIVFAGAFLGTLTAYLFLILVLLLCTQKFFR